MTKYREVYLKLEHVIGYSDVEARISLNHQSCNTMMEKSIMKLKMMELFGSFEKWVAIDTEKRDF